ncbi:MAG: hypothetical protein V1910_02040 [bacterium]
MINQDLLKYIENEISKGTPRNIIQSNLLLNGWNERDIAESFSTIVAKNPNTTVIPIPININTNKILHISGVKKIILVILSIFVIIWLGLEVVNFSEYVSVRSAWDKGASEESPFMPGPFYRPVVTQVFYNIFPSFNPNTRGMPYKPVIYLYPTSTEKVQIELDYKGNIVADYPTYDVLQKGWTVTASPDGKIVSSDGKEYSYLFWEGKPSNKIDYDLSTGFVVRGEDTIEFLQNTLSKIGLTPKEYNEFIVYWYPKMKDNKYNLIHFAGDEYTQTAPLTIVPKPDSMLRVFMVFKPLNNMIDIKPQEIKSFVRKGFTVIEWGGTNL